MDAVLFSCPTWFYMDSDGQERGPFSAADMLEWYRHGYFPGTVKEWYWNGFFPAKLAVRPNIHSVFTTLSSLVLGNVVEPIDNVHPAAKRQKVEEKLSELSETEHDEEYVEHDIKEECVKSGIKDKCFKLEIKEECVKTEIKVKCLKTKIQKEYLKPEMEECTILKIKKEESKLADIHRSVSEQEYIETEISKESLKLESKEECLKNEIKEEGINLEVKEEYINLEIKDKGSNHEMKKEYIKPEIENEYTSTRHKKKVPQSLQNDAKSYEGINKLKLKGGTKQGAPFKERTGKSSILKCSRVKHGILKFSRGIIKSNLSRSSNKHVQFDPVVMEINGIKNKLKAQRICLAGFDRKPAYQTFNHRLKVEFDLNVEEKCSEKSTWNLHAGDGPFFRSESHRRSVGESGADSNHARGRERHEQVWHPSHSKRAENCFYQMEKGEIPSSHGADNVDMDAQGGGLGLNLPEPVPASKEQREKISQDYVDPEEKNKERQNSQDWTLLLNSRKEKKRLKERLKVKEKNLEKDEVNLAIEKIINERKGKTAVRDFSFQDPMKIVALQEVTGLNRKIKNINDTLNLRKIHTGFSLKRERKKKIQLMNPSQLSNVAAKNAKYLNTSKYLKDKKLKAMERKKMVL